MMAYKERIDEIMERKMDRLEFLRLSLLIVAGVAGISRLLDTVSHTAGPRLDSGYGGGAYGGINDGSTSIRTSNPKTSNPPLVHL